MNNNKKSKESKENKQKTQPNPEGKSLERKQM